MYKRLYFLSYFLSSFLSLSLSSNSLYLLVSVSQRVMFAHEGRPTYLDKCLSMSLVVLKRLVDKLVVSFCSAIFFYYCVINTLQLIIVYCKL